PIFAELDVVALDEWVREQLLAHALDLTPRLGLVDGVEFELDQLADARVSHGEAEVPQAALDRLALRIEDARLRTHEDGRPHPSTISGCATYCSNGMPLSRSNASTYRARVPSTTSSGSSGPG